MMANLALDNRKSCLLGRWWISVWCSSRLCPIRREEKRREETGIQSSLSEEDMKQYLEQVIGEVKMQRPSNKKGRTNNGNV
jgi:hypothetical protein